MMNQLFCFYLKGRCKVNASGIREGGEYMSRVSFFLYSNNNCYGIVVRRLHLFRYYT